MYAHVGLVNGILLAQLSIDPKHLPDAIELTLNVEGGPVSKISGKQLWPILVRIHSIICFGSIVFLELKAPTPDVEKYTGRDESTREP